MIKKISNLKLVFEKTYLMLMAGTFLFLYSCNQPAEEEDSANYIAEPDYSNCVTQPPANPIPSVAPTAVNYIPFIGNGNLSTNPTTYDVEVPFLQSSHLGMILDIELADDYLYMADHSGKYILKADLCTEQISLLAGTGIFGSTASDDLYQVTTPPETIINPRTTNIVPHTIAVEGDYIYHANLDYRTIFRYKTSGEPLTFGDAYVVGDLQASTYDVAEYDQNGKPLNGVRPRDDYSMGRAMQMAIDNGHLYLTDDLNGVVKRIKLPDANGNVEVASINYLIHPTDALRNAISGLSNIGFFYDQGTVYHINFPAGYLFKYSNFNQVSISDGPFTTTEYLGSGLGTGDGPLSTTGKMGYVYGLSKLGDFIYYMDEPSSGALVLRVLSPDGSLTTPIIKLEGNPVDPALVRHNLIFVNPVRGVLYGTARNIIYKIELQFDP